MRFRRRPSVIRAKPAPPAPATETLHARAVAEHAAREAEAAERQAERYRASVREAERQARAYSAGGAWGLGATRSWRDPVQQFIQKIREFTR
jgi:hypothetical protein